jgi:hypothetical protein
VALGAWIDDFTRISGFLPLVGAAVAEYLAQRELFRRWSNENPGLERVPGPDGDGESVRQAALRENHPKNSATRMGWRSGKLATVALNDHSADRKAQSHPAWLCGHEGIEHFVQAPCIDAGAGIPDLHGNCLVAIAPGAHRQQPMIVLDCVHCLHRVVQQINDNLLQLTPVSDDMRHAVHQFASDRNAMVIEQAAHSL